MNNQLWLIMFFVVILGVLGIFALTEKRRSPASSPPPAEPTYGLYGGAPLMFNGAILPATIDLSDPPKPPMSTYTPYGAYSQQSLGFPISNYWPRPDMVTFPEFTIPTYINAPDPGPSPGP